MFCEFLCFLEVFLSFNVLFMLIGLFLSSSLLRNLPFVDIDGIDTEGIHGELSGFAIMLNYDLLKGNRINKLYSSSVFINETVDDHETELIYRTGHGYDQLTMLVRLKM